MPQTSALSPAPSTPNKIDINTPYSSLDKSSPPIVPASAATRGGMLQTPYTSSNSVSSSDDSPSPRTPAISDSASNASPRPTPSPNIQALSLVANANESDTGICASDPERLSPVAKREDNASTRPPEVVLSMQQPGQQNLPQQPQQNQGKGGCWTCRIRRKKCDEQRTGDSCQTCIRLRIDCLGWGPKRPAWMRDKQAVEAYKAGIKEKLIKAGMVRGQPRLTQASRSTTLPSGSSTPSGSSGHVSYGQQHHPAHRSMSGPAAFGGIGAMGSVGPMGAIGVMGSSAPGGGMSLDFNQQQQHLQPPTSRYEPYPSPRSFQGFHSSHLTAQQAQHIPQASSVMGPEFDYLSFPDQGEHDLLQQHHLSRRSSFGVPSPQERNAEQLERRRHSLAFSSSPSLAGGSASSHGGSPYISGHASIGGPFGGSSSSQGPRQSLVDYTGTGDVFGNLSSNIGGGMADLSPALGGLTVPDMNNMSGVSGLSSSPSMLADDETLLFPSGGTYGAPTSRSSSTSVPGSAASRSDSSQSAGYIDPLTDPALVDPHVQYYFDSVMPMQYAFAADRARSALQNSFAREPYGPLVNASCALAARHNKTIRVARLLDQPDADPQQSTAQQFYNRACWQLANKTTTVHVSDIGAATPSAGYSASDALASLHLVAYFLLQGGTGDWPMHLDMAREWLTQTGLCTPENEAPRETLTLMDEADQLAVKLTIWYDVIAAISQHESPRFVETYRRLFGGIVSRETSGQTTGTIDMAHFMGCPEDVFLILAETAALAHWKAHERRLGTLSNRELLNRGVAIENRLLVSSIADGNAPTSSVLHDARVETSLMHAAGTSEEHLVPSPAAPAVQIGQESSVAPSVDAASALSLASTSTAPFNPVASDNGELKTEGHGRISPENKRPADVYQRVSKVFLHAASLYLASVINEPSPSIPEINNAVNAIVNDLANLSNFSVDRMLALPIALAGCMTDHPEQRLFIRSRLTSLDEIIGNVRSVRLLMERVWDTRDNRGGVVDWRDVMRNDFGVEILLV